MFATSRSTAAARRLLLSHKNSNSNRHLYRFYATRLWQSSSSIRAAAAPAIRHSLWRPLSSSSSNNSTSQKQNGGEEDPGSEIVLTPGEKVVAASRLTLWAGAAVLAAVCAYFIGSELFPTKLSPNRIFDRSLAIVRQDPEIQRRYGASLKAYGRDHGGHREGRRNFIEHTEYTDPEDGSKRVRVRYNIEGQFGTAFCFAEMSNQYDDGFVYILVQDKTNGRVTTVVDNRAALTTQRLAGGSQEAQSAMAQLMGGSNSK